MKKYLFATVVAMMCLSIYSCGGIGSEKGTISSGYSAEDILEYTVSGTVSEDGLKNAANYGPMEVKDSAGKLVVEIVAHLLIRPDERGTLEVGHLRYVNTDEKPAVGDTISFIKSYRDNEKTDIFHVYRYEHGKEVFVSACRDWKKAHWEELKGK